MPVTPKVEAEWGVLYVVATPLGNLSDLTIRAADLLRRVEVVAAEDTRRTQTLLHHLGASPKLISYHAHSPKSRIETLLEMLRVGKSIALVTDAGTPTVSDPGAELIAEARATGFSVIPIPGPSAVVTALSASGFSADRYLFLGFLPRKGRERARLIARVLEEEWTVVLFEAPQRLVALLLDLGEAVGMTREAVVARELTKIHEEFRSGTLGTLHEYFSQVEPRGEITVLLKGTGAPPTAPDRTAEAIDLATELLAAGQSRKEAVAKLMESLGLARNEAYRLVLNLP